MGPQEVRVKKSEYILPAKKNNRYPQTGIRKEAAGRICGLKNWVPIDSEADFQTMQVKGVQKETRSMN